MKKITPKRWLVFFGKGMQSLGLVAVRAILLVGFVSALTFGQGQTKPLIKVVATGGTIANTLDGRISHPANDRRYS